MEPPWPVGSELIVFGLGCFWGAERRFWETAGVHSTQVGYAAVYLMVAYMAWVYPYI